MTEQELINSNLFEEITTEGRSTLILKKPVQIVVPASVLAILTRIYPKNKETGGFLYAKPDKTSGQLQIVSVVEVPNGSTTDVAYQPFAVPYQSAIADAIKSGLLPLRFHSHPVQTVNDRYNIQSLNFFNKTSQADRHTSYIPIWIGSQAIVLPDCLISPNDREGKTIRFSIYNGFIAPNSFAALLPNEQAFLIFTVIELLLIQVNFGLKLTIIVCLLFLLIGIIIFIKEKRPNYTYVDSELYINV